MNLRDNITKVEIEITSNCNAKCPGCARTQRAGEYEVTDISLYDILEMFPSYHAITDKKFKLCGVLGDPIINEDCLDIVTYITSNNGWCQLSTNAGLRNNEFWTTLGTISKTTGLVDINFCIDGHEETNHIYRVGTVWKNIERNLEAYCNAPGPEGSKVHGTWIYIVFDHNEHELEIARAHAERLGLKFATRTGMRNSMSTWVADIKRKDAKTRKIIEEKKIITTTGIKEHSKVEQVKELITFNEQTKQLKQSTTLAAQTPSSTEYKQPASAPEKNKIIEKPIIDSEYLKQKEKIVSSIRCKLVHEQELFIASNMTLWPCCFLWDSYFKNKENIRDVYKKYDGDWNSLKTHSIDDILQHPWFAEVLRLSWDTDHEQHIPKCIEICGYNKAYQNEIKIL